MKRSAGILLSISSLPSKYGIGCFSESAYKFVDWLEAAGQTYWQILPLGPASYGDSPYQSFSTFAGNPYFISLEEFISFIGQSFWIHIDPRQMCPDRIRKSVGFFASYSCIDSFLFVQLLSPPS